MTEDAFIVQGGIPLKGEITLSGAKNIALKVLITGLLYDKPITFHNIPQIKDIDELLHLINSLGAQGKFVDTNTVKIDSTGLSHDTIDLLHGARIRTSFMFFVPLLHRLGKARIPNPGGCRLGARSIDRHIKMLKAFEVSISYDSETGYYDAHMTGSIKGTDFTFDKPTHTGTELALMIGSIAEGTSTIHNAALEPEIDDLINLLNMSGAKIIRKNTDIIIEGCKKLDLQADSYTIANDRNEAPTFASFALATQGDIIVKGLQTRDIRYFINEVEKVGGGVEDVKNGIRFYYKGDLRATDITTLPHPGFMTDWQGPWAILMTQANGISTIHETIFENRFGYVSELLKLGAKIEFFQPEVDKPEDVYQFNASAEEISALQQAIKIHGQTPLHNGVLDVKDLRAGATILIAATVAHGESVISGASIIDRGYEHIEKKLSKLGARIKRV